MEDVLESSRCAQLLKAIADPDRLRIVQCLRDGEHNVGEIAAKLDADIANVSHHLGVLRHSGFILADKQGRFVVYSLNPEMFIAKPSGKAPNRIELGCCRIDLP